MDDDDTRNMNLSKDLTEEDLVTKASKELVTNADSEIDELEKELIFLQIELASAAGEHWLNELYNALREHVDSLEMALVGLRNNIMSPIEARRRLYREPAKKLDEILNALMARFSLSGSGLGTDECDNPLVTPLPPCVQYPELPKPINAAVSSTFHQTRSPTLKARDPFAPVSQPKKVSARSSQPRGRPEKERADGTSSPPAGEPEISREKKIPTRRRTRRPLRDFY